MNHFFQQVELDPGLRLVLRQRNEVQLQQRRAHDGLVFTVHGRNETFQQNKMISKIQSLPKLSLIQVLRNSFKPNRTSILTPSMQGQRHKLRAMLSILLD